MSSTGSDLAPAEGRAREASAAWLRAELQRVRKPLSGAALLTGMLALALVAQAWLLSGILAAALFAHAPLARLWPQWLGLLLLALLRFGLNVRVRSTVFRAAQRLTGNLRARLLRGARGLGPYGLRAHASGDLITRLVDGIDAVLAYFARYLPQLAAAVLIPPLLALCVFPADWLSGLILLLTAPLIPLFMVLVGRAAAHASERRYAQLTRLGAAFIEALGGLVALRQLGAADRFARRLDGESEEYRLLTMQVLRVAFLSALVLEFFATVSIALVAVLIGFRLLWGELHFRAGLFVLLLAPEFYLPLRALGGLRHTRMDALAAAQHLAVLDATPSAAGGSPAGVAPTSRAAPPEIRLEHVSYVHAGRRAGLRDCTLVVRPRMVTALVGATGAGKSTLLNLLLGFAAPDSGRISVDGVDLAALDPALWRDCVAWVPQQAHVFEGTLRDNLLLAAPKADAAALWRAAEGSGLAAVLARQPKGWDTPLGERGLGLSGGELQRLALARALLREQARVWLLDEPTAHLDAVSARAVEAVIHAAAASRTVVWVAHRLSAARAADRVAVLDAGRVIEQGTPLELSRARGSFTALLEAEQS
ncbi:MAG TPA: thiol reductant ABC exporter subunit CydD [Steroidobacteraceae bacterium]|nr:thiol reductant ABC exporter subunit CydD [Steroidobacteraceae bacterium]